MTANVSGQKVFRSSGLGTGKRVCSSLFALASVLIACNVGAQRANENAVTEASDAFGTAVGRESIGLYTSMLIRGFNPLQAGNLRISGLYFDQTGMAPPVNRIVRGSTVHVGISAQGFPFPAPTGVVDFQLRNPGPEPGLSTLVGLGSFGQSYSELDFQLPLDEQLRLGAGFGYARNTNNFRSADLTDEWTGGAIARWQPTQSLVVTPFWGINRHRESGKRPFVFAAESGAPRFHSTDLQFQPWSTGGFNSLNFGTTATYAFLANWKVDAGIFRSQLRTKINYEAFLTDTNELGDGDYSLSVQPARTIASTSGEVRLSRRFDARPIRSTLYFAVKGRERDTESGGTDRRLIGRASGLTIPQAPKPDFHTGELTQTTARHLTPGLGYEGLWPRRGQVTIGIQKPFYDRTVSPPQGVSVSSSSNPWLYNAAGALFLSDRLLFYASSTRGFEEIAGAPNNAANRDEPVPAQVTRQVDAGMRFQFTPRLQLVAGVFEIDKPYFNLDPQNIYRELGSTSNRGAEVSLSGTLTDRLTIVAGLIAIDAKVQYDPGANARSSAVAIGPIPGLFRANVQYRLPTLEALVLETKIEATSSRLARYEVNLPPFTTVDVGARYSSRIFGNSATYRLQLLNITNEYGLNPMPSGQLAPVDGRRVEFSLAVDI